MSDAANSIARRYPQFNPAVHPQLIFNSMLMKVPMETLANQIGIPRSVLDEWIDEHKELQVAARDAATADAKVLASLFYAATGWDPYANRPAKKGPDVKAALAWLKQRQQWREEPRKSPIPIDQMTPAQLVDLLRALESVITARPAVAAGGTIVEGVSEPVHENTDAGF